MNNKQIEVWIASPHQFFREHQLELLPDWDVAVVAIILLLQRSQISLQEFNAEVIQEKDRLRASFIRFGCDLIFQLKDLGYQSDLFDPRDGYPLLSHQGKLTVDDNAIVNSLLHYSVSSYKKCSLIEHPTWGHNVYPGTIVTRANQDTVEAVLSRNSIKLDKVKII